VVAGLVLSALLLRRRAALPVVALGALAAVPCLALVALSRANGTGTSAAGWIRESESPVPLLALQAWTGSGVLLLAVLLAALAAAAVAVLRRAEGRALAVVATCWLVVPLALVQLAELARPVFVPRYLLPALVALAILAALGLASWRRAVAVPRRRCWSRRRCWPCCRCTSAARARTAAARSRRWSRCTRTAGGRRRRPPGGPRARALRPGGAAGDLVVPPDDPPRDADVVWLLRQSTGERVRPSDDDLVLLAAGLAVAEQRVFDGTSSDLVLQRWER
jgi:hypothetical protein